MAGAKKFPNPTSLLATCRAVCHCHVSQKDTTTMRARLLHVPVLLWWWLLLATTVTCQAINGGDSFQQGMELFQEGSYPQAAAKFWEALLHSGSHDTTSTYSVNQALQNVLVCFQRQGSLAEGYAFVALQMHTRGDLRARDFLKQAYELDSSHSDVLMLMNRMGETPQTLLSKRIYKEEEDVVKISQHSDNSDVMGSCTNAQQCQAHFDEALEQESSSGRGAVDMSNNNRLVSGWDPMALQMYENAILELDRKSIRTIHIPGTVSPIVVSDDPWWDNIDGKLSWEPETFQIFQNHIHKNTTVVDFGTWIGPTIFFHAMLSKKSYGLEADPVAYATVERNVALNADQHDWARHIQLEPVAVSTPTHAGPLTMKSAGAGNSASGLGNRVAGGWGGQQWTVNGYTLPYIFASWGLRLSEQDVFIKIDIESYECPLFPSFYDWLKHETRLPTIFVSFHPQVEPCTKSQMMQVLRTFKLFESITCGKYQNKLPIVPETKFEEFEQMLDDANCWTNKDDSDFVCSGKAEHVYP